MSRKANSVQKYHPLIQNIKKEKFSALTVFQTVLLPSVIQNWISDHKIKAVCVFPGAAMLELAIASAYLSGIGDEFLACEGFIISSSLIVKNNSNMLGTINSNNDYHCYNANNNQRQEICQGRILQSTAEEFLKTSKSFEISSEMMSDDDFETVVLNDMSEWYASLHARYGLLYGKSFQLVELVQIGKGVAQSKISLANVASRSRDHLVSPLIIDAMFQTTLALAYSDENFSNIDNVLVPYAIDYCSMNINILRTIHEDSFCTCNVIMRNTEKYLVFDAILYKASGEAAVILKNVYVKPYNEKNDHDDEKHFNQTYSQKLAMTSDNTIANATSIMTMSTLKEIVKLAVMRLISDPNNLYDDSILLDIGLDSMGATELSVELSNTLQIRLLPTLALSHPTVNDIVDYCWEQINKSENNNATNSSREDVKNSDDDSTRSLNLKEVVSKVKDIIHQWSCDKLSEAKESVTDDQELSSFVETCTNDNITQLHSLLCNHFLIAMNSFTVSTTIRQIIEMIVASLGFAQALLASADVQSVAKGDLYMDNPWFANYFCSSVARGRVIIFGGLAQPTISWYGFAKIMNDNGLHVHAVRLPGRFDRPTDDPMLDANDITKDVVEAMKLLNFLDGLPIFCFGYSYGALMAYLCAQYLQCSKYSVAHFVCISGPHRSRFDTWKFMDPDDRDVEHMKECSIHNLGSFNPGFDTNFQYMPDILEYFFTVLNRDYEVCKSWVKAYDLLKSDDKLLRCDVTCIAGEDDKCINNKGWRDIATKNYQQIYYPGDHFFIFQNNEFDKVVAIECCRVMLRSLQIYI